MPKKVSKNKTLDKKVKKTKEPKIDQVVKTPKEPKVAKAPKKSKKATDVVTIPAYDANGSYIEDYDCFVCTPDTKTPDTKTPEQEAMQYLALVEEEKQLEAFLENVARADALALYAKKPWYEKFWDFLKAMFS